MRLLSLFIAVFALHFTPAFAENGMRTIYNNAKEPPQTAPGMKTLNYVRPHAGPEAKKDNSADEVWEKYKALAAGTAQKEESDEPEPEPEKQAAQAAPTEPPPATGFAAILQDYKKNKAQRAQMRTLTVNKPATEKE